MVPEKARRPLSEAAKSEIERFEEEVELLAKGERDPDDFKVFRLENGVYGIRFSPDTHMVRIKIPYGHLSADQLDVIVGLAEKFTPTQLSHVTTRQNIQIHDVPRKDASFVLRTLNECGLTTREACGNTVRNVTCDELAGICHDEVFNPIPYADLFFRYFLRNPVCQNLPRKFKVAFEGSATSDRARINIHDLGFRAVIKEIDGKPRKGFIVTVGGGLGSIPHPAQLLEEFIPVERMLSTGEAVLRIQDRHGERKDRNRARLKFLVAKWGIEEFRKAVEHERRIAESTTSGYRANFKIEWQETEVAPVIEGDLIDDKDTAPGYEEWFKTNALPHRIKDHSAVYVRCYLGDVNPEQGRVIAQLARAFGGGSIVTSITQNLLLSCIPNRALKTVYTKLHKAEMGLAHAQYIADITRCPGADTCNLAVTHSKGLAHDVTQKVFLDGYSSDPELQAIEIKISGCTNSCGQHHIADLGFFGSSRSFNGKPVPHYTLLLGGRTGVKLEATKFGERVGIFPAKRVHEVVKHMLDLYKKDKESGESFKAWTDRRGKDFFKQELEPYQSCEPYQNDPTIYEDIGDEGNPFAVKIGKGECAV